MRAGLLKHRVVIESPSTTSDAFGQSGTSWSEVVTVWASIEPLRGRELLLAQQVQSEVTHRVRMRYRSGLGPETRLKYGSRVFEVLSIINPSESDRELELLCRELP